MNQSELYWSRWKQEESMRIYHNHVRRKNLIGPAEDALKHRKKRNKDNSNRDRYIRHRKAAQELRRKMEQKRIDRENELLKSKIKSVKKSYDDNLNSSQKRKDGKRKADPIKKKELMISNISLLRRIVAAKPFATRSQWKQERKEMERYLDRLKQTRDERQAVINRRQGVPLSPLGSPTKVSMPRSPTSPSSPPPPEIKYLHVYEEQAKTRQLASKNVPKLESLSKHHREVHEEIHNLEKDFEALFKRSPKKAFSPVPPSENSKKKKTSKRPHRKIVSKNKQDDDDYQQQLIQEIKEQQPVVELQQESKEQQPDVEIQQAKQQKLEREEEAAAAAAPASDAESEEQYESEFEQEEQEQGKEEEEEVQDSSDERRMSKKFVDSMLEDSIRSFKENR